MDNNTTVLAIMTAFVCIAALALIIQAGMMWGMYRATRILQARAGTLLPKMEALMDTSRGVIEDSRGRILDITTKANDVLETARRQMIRVDEVLADASVRTHRQLAQADAVLDEAMYRAQETVHLVHSGLMAPLREINGIAAGLKAAIQHLIRTGRPAPDRLHVDEEMFI